MCEKTEIKRILRQKTLNINNNIIFLSKSISFPFIPKNLEVIIPN
jgi:hypothetical protein